MDIGRIYKVITFSNSEEFEAWQMKMMPYNIKVTAVTPMINEVTHNIDIFVTYLQEGPAQ